MSKKNRQQVRELLANALEPPRRQPSKSSMDELLEKYDDGQPIITPATPVTGVTPVEKHLSAEPARPEIKTLVPEPTPIAPVTTPTPVTPARPSRGQSLDATHTQSEQQVYSVMYRQTITQGKTDRHFGPAELMRLTGIRSDKTIRKAIDGLIAKMSIEILSYRQGAQEGPLYRIYTPIQIFEKRSRSGIEIEPIYRKVISSTPVTGVTGVTEVDYAPVTPAEFTGVTGGSHDHVLNKEEYDDESPLGAGLRSFFPDLGQDEINSARMEIEKLLMAELERRAGKATTPLVSPTYFVECVRRLCSASHKEGKSKPAGSTGRRQLEQIIAKVRELHIGGDAEGLRQHIERECRRQGIGFDLDLFKEIIQA